MTKKIFKIGGMDCDACAKMIELDLEDLGVKCKCNFAQETLEIEMVEQIAEQQIIEVVRKSGYKIEDKEK